MSVKWVGSDDGVDVGDEDGGGDRERERMCLLLNYDCRLLQLSVCPG